MIKAIIYAFKNKLQIWEKDYQDQVLQNLREADERIWPSMFDVSIETPKGETLFGLSEEERESLEKKAKSKRKKRE